MGRGVARLSLAAVLVVTGLGACSDDDGEPATTGPVTVTALEDPAPRISGLRPTPVADGRGRLAGFGEEGPEAVDAAPGVARPLVWSDDGGLTWHRSEKPEATSFARRQLWAAGDVLLAVSPAPATGTPGPPSVWTSIDGGRTFVAGTGPEDDSTPSAVIALDDAIVVLAGRGGGHVLWTSTDDGRSWTSTPLPPEVQVEGVAAAGSALLAPGVGRVARSTDGGRTWATVALPGPETHPWAVAAVGDVAWTLASEGLHRSTDGGATWEALPPLPIGPDGIPAVDGLHDVVAAPGGGYVARATTPGGDGYQAVMLHSEDGRRWEVAELGVACDAYPDIESIWHGSPVAVGDRLVAVWECKEGRAGVDRLLSSTDGGRTWAPLAAPGADGLHLSDPVALADDRVLVLATRGARRAAIHVTP